jgi:MraZ protein
MLRGNQPATVDDKGRIKIPTLFRTFIRDTWGAELFLTSVDGKNVRVYPLSVWAGVEERASKAPAMTPALQKFMDFVAYYGQLTTMDKQGRVLVPALLREDAQISGEVVVMGKMDYLVVWNHEVFRNRLDREPLTTEDFQTLAELQI